MPLLYICATSASSWSFTESPHFPDAPIFCFCRFAPNRQATSSGRSCCCSCCRPLGACSASRLVHLFCRFAPHRQATSSGRSCCCSCCRPLGACSASRLIHLFVASLQTAEQLPPAAVVLAPAAGRFHPVTPKTGASGTPVSARVRPRDLFTYLPLPDWAHPAA